MYNEEKTIKWLTMKAKAVARILKEKQINVRKNSASKNFVKVLDDEPKDFSKNFQYYLQTFYGKSKLFIFIYLIFIMTKYCPNVLIITHFYFVGEKLYLKYAFELLSEYLMDDLSLKLSSTLGISFECADKTTANKRKPSQSIAHEIDKKFKADEKCSISKVGKNRDALLKEYKKQKAVNKSITSFFVKK